MKQADHPRRGREGVSCPLCSHTDVRYRKESDTWVCRHCDYRWYTIEHCTLS